MTDNIKELVHVAVLAMEVVAVVIIVAGLAVGMVRFAVQVVRRVSRADAYHGFRVWMGRALLLGLEILVAADVVNTVALEPTLGNVMALGLLVVIRTFLGWGLVVEIEGRWPWQSKSAPASVSREL
jgi:uncharacterized membrane protein